MMGKMSAEIHATNFPSRTVVEDMVENRVSKANFLFHFWSKEFEALSYNITVCRFSLILHVLVLAYL